MKVCRSELLSSDLCGVLKRSDWLNGWWVHACDLEVVARVQCQELADEVCRTVIALIVTLCWLAPSELVPAGSPPGPLPKASPEAH
jgi:hypothetical protein